MLYKFQLVFITYWALHFYDVDLVIPEEAKPYYLNLVWYNQMVVSIVVVSLVI